MRILRNVVVRITLGLERQREREREREREDVYSLQNRSC